MVIPLRGGVVVRTVPLENTKPVRLKTSVLEFRLFQTPVRIQPLFWAVAAYISWVSAEGADDALARVLASIPVILVGVLLHEFGHVLAARQFGLVASVELYAFGGVTRWREKGAPLSPARRLWVSFAGPLAGILLGLALAVAVMVGAPPPESLASHLLWFGVWVNLGWGLLNLFPMLPLDGGHMLAAVFEWVLGPKGRTASLWLSLVVGAGLAIAAIAYGAWMLFGIAVYLGMRNFQAMRADRVLGPDVALVPKLREAQLAIEHGAHARAYEAAMDVVRAATMPAVLADAWSVAAYAAASDGNGDKAKEALAQLPAHRRSEPLLQGLVRYADGEFDGAVPLLEEAYKSGATFVQERLADALAQTGQWVRAREVFTGGGAGRATVRTLRALERSAYESGAFHTSAALGGVLFDRDQSATRAYNVACSFARAGEAADAFRWLECAVQRGFDRFELLDEDTDLADLRTHEDWDRHRAALASTVR